MPTSRRITSLPEVHGLVVAVLARQRSRAGDPLVRIDAEDSRTHGVRQCRSIDAEAASAAASAALTSLDAEEAGACRRGKRPSGQPLHSPNAPLPTGNGSIGSSAQVQCLHTMDAVRAAAIARNRTSRVEAMLNVAAKKGRHRGTAFDAHRGSTQSRRARRAGACCARSRQDQSRALIVAPIDGVVGNRQVQQGDYVQPGRGS
jgi:membrane fusion protein (multidrug efflux system)